MTKDHRAFGVPPSIPFRFFSKNECAKMLNCTTRTIDRLVASGKIPYIRVPTGIGKSTRVKFDSRDIEKWINDRRVAPGEDER